MIFTPVFDLPWWGLVLVTLGITHITIVSVTLYLHRHQAHRAMELHPAVAHFFRFWLWITTGMVTREWVAVHRKHHARVETPDDPHSPQVYGISRVFFNGVSLYRNSARDPSTLEQFGHGTPDDFIENLLYARYPWSGNLTLLVINTILFGLIAGPLIWGVQMLWIPLWAAGVINGVGHWFGYRNFETRDSSRNIVPWGILIGGEELHNNHHAYASSAKFSNKWYELDIGWLYLNGLSMLGLARINRTVPRIRVEEVKSRCDLETVNAVIANRFQVLADFFSEVVKRVYREELKARRGMPERSLIKRAVKALNRPHGTNHTATHAFTEYLDLSPRLKTVLNMKSKLVEIWASGHSSPESLIQKLEEWCAQAESSGIKVLGDFSTRLRGYRLVPA
ncbi:MAG: aminotransferase [marine bacterium B5-7]|nr:MAG: aminotransferase [marine bacterium B5-7]